MNTTQRHTIIPTNHMATLIPTLISTTRMASPISRMAVLLPHPTITATPREVLDYLKSWVARKPTHATR